MTSLNGRHVKRVKRSNIEVVIPAFNEELNLPWAIKSVQGWADAVWVVDSESTDRTRQIAEALGANVVVRPWLGYAKQKNWALDNLPLQSDWVFILDSDESITPELRDEISAIAARPVGEVHESGFYVNRMTYFLGRPIRHCGYFPSYNLRMFKRGKAHYEEREVHEHMIVDGPTTRLTNLMNHEDRRGLEHLIAKHNRYSTLEARELTRERMRREGEKAGPLERGIAMRRWLKRHVLPRLPLSGVWRFLYMYIIRLGILDGATGLRFCLLLATYDLLISLKLAEIRSLRLEDDSQRLENDPAKGLAIPEGRMMNTAATVAAPPTPPPAPPVQVAVPPYVMHMPGTAPLRQPEALGSLGQRLIDPVIPVGQTPPADVPLRPEPEGPPAPEPLREAVPRLVEELNPRENVPGVWPAYKSVPVSILVPVKNEQRNIVECLRRCNWATELVVVDSRSTDQTIELSQAMGADVYQFNYNRKTGWPKKKNWALESIPWKNEWVMILDADEYMTPELAEEIKRVVTGQWTPQGSAKRGCGDGYWVNRRFMFFGRWLKGCGYYPSWNVRLLKHRLGRYERIGNLGDTGSGDNEVHEHIVLSSGEAGYLQHEFLHYAYPDLSAWIEKHNRYTTWEAFAMEAGDEGAVNAKLFGGPIERRRWIKRFGRKLPFRPTLRFIYSYLFQKGWLDGYPGLVMCRLLSWYEFVSIAKHREMMLAKREQQVREHKTRFR
ncbi:MAG: glycosyltransferase family 2 protein [Planctomycetes bacterium]|nr:glycosyltransferase family 2 protein [Planctomycetota bacterium]